MFYMLWAEERKRSALEVSYGLRWCKNAGSFLPWERTQRKRRSRSHDHISFDYTLLANDQQQAHLVGSLTEMEVEQRCKASRL
jgi:hypothetical protein